MVKRQQYAWSGKRKHKIRRILSFDLERAVVVKCPYKLRKI